MVSFENDYNTGCTPEILEAMSAHNLVRTTGYGMDEITESAKNKIRAAIGQPDAEVFFLVGGTQTNLIAVDTLLKPWEGVVAAETGHVEVHEAGAIEYTGRKVLTISGKNGKLDAADLKKYVETFYKDGNHEHMVFPGMVYISYPTELGTLYTKAELTELSEVCHDFNMPLYLDGARMGYGLMSHACDMTIRDIAALCDAFYIGGTKVGALFGEALVFKKEICPQHFVNQIKKHGALLAKGWLAAQQFDVLFTDDLYLKISKNAIDRAEELKEIFLEKGYRFLFESPTNQQYFVVENSQMEALSQKVVFSFWDTVDDTHTAIRFVTNWATTKEDVETLRTIL